MARKGVLKVIVAHSLAASPIIAGESAYSAASQAKIPYQKSSQECTEEARAAYAQYLLESALNGMEAVLEDPCADLHIQDVGYVFKLEPTEPETDDPTK